jgi:hypothetical protein
VVSENNFSVASSPLAVGLWACGSDDPHPEPQIIPVTASISAAMQIEPVKFYSIELNFNYWGKIYFATI